jgi:hypothetical protein
MNSAARSVFVFGLLFRIGFRPRRRRAHERRAQKKWQGGKNAGGIFHGKKVTDT